MADDASRGNSMPSWPVHLWLRGTHYFSQCREKRICDCCLWLRWLQSDGLRRVLKYPCIWLSGEHFLASWNSVQSGRLRKLLWDFANGIIVLWRLKLNAVCKMSFSPYGKSMHNTKWSKKVEMNDVPSFHNAHDLEIRTFSFQNVSIYIVSGPNRHNKSKNHRLRTAFSDLSRCKTHSRKQQTNKNSTKRIFSIRDIIISCPLLMLLCLPLSNGATPLRTMYERHWKLSVCLCSDWRQSSIRNLDQRSLSHETHEWNLSIITLESIAILSCAWSLVALHCLLVLYCVTRRFNRS